VIVAGGSAAMSGWAIWGSDIGGYQESNPSATPENLFMRWTQFGALSPIMQMHRQVGGGHQYPWSYGPDALANYVAYARLHTALFPYLYAYAHVAAATGLPILRPPVLQHPDDAATYDLAHTYYLGDWLLVAPVIENVATHRSVYLPDGVWYDWFTGAEHTGGTTLDWQSSDQSRMPLFARAGAIIPMLPEDTTTLVAVPDELVVRVYPAPASGPPGSTSSDFRTTDAVFTATSSADEIVIAIDTHARPIELRVKAADPLAVLVDGVDVPWTSSSGVVVIPVAHPGGTSTISLRYTAASPDAGLAASPDAGPAGGTPTAAGCACRTSSRSTSGLATLLLIALTLLAAPRRRRPRR
jgi:alpha-D-xyloside xylohydrolase